MAEIGETTTERIEAVITDTVAGSWWITAQLRQAILGGRYAYGEKLPAERPFASASGASRATIRTALNRLEAERLVTRRLGAGTFVNFRGPGDSKGIAELTSPLELIEVRLEISRKWCISPCSTPAVRTLRGWTVRSRAWRPRAPTAELHLVGRGISSADLGGDPQSAHGLGLPSDQCRAHPQSVERHEGQSSDSATHRRIQSAACGALRSHSYPRYRDGRGHRHRVICTTRGAS